ncbi:MAG: hypothetical protein SFY96_00215 [Planctomycetota bacterium]|nr:hypothetical protein [Planctomycetota bacterium]
MCKRRALLESIHLVALAIWLAMLATAAIGASLVFPAMRAAHASVPDYPAYPAEAWRLAGGLAASPIFFFTAKVQSWCGLVAALSFLGALTRGVRLRSPIGAARLVLLLVGCATLTYYTHSYIPTMHSQLDLLLAASADPARAEEAKAAQGVFDNAHTLGSPLISTMGLAILAAMALVPLSMRSAACDATSSTMNTATNARTASSRSNHGNA